MFDPELWKNGPCFPAERPHYETVEELPTNKHNSLTSHGSEWRGTRGARQATNAHSNPRQQAPAARSVSLGQGCMLGLLTHWLIHHSCSGALH